MATLEQLSTALINADAAGDVEAARVIAGEIKRLKAQSSDAPPADPIKQRAKQEYDDAIAKGIPVQAGATRRLLQGATLNFGDEILAGLKTPFEMAKRGTWNPIEGYQSAKAAEDIALDEARKTGGIGGALAEIGGGVLSGAGLAGGGLTAGRALSAGSGFFPRLGASTADAAGFGALAGFGDGGSLGERLGGAAQGGAIGGAVGAAGPIVLGLGGQALAPIVNNVRARINPEGFARSQVARGVVESGQSPQQVAGAVANAANEGQPMFTLADAMGNAGQRMLATTARSPGAARTQVVDFLDQRQAGQGRRIANTLAEGFETPQTAAQTRTAMTTARDDAADVAYGAARQNAGQVDLTGVIARIDETLQPGVNRIAQSGIANDSIEGALQGIRNRLTDGRSVLTDFTAVQRVRGDLSDMIQTAVRGGQGNRARLLGQALRELDTAMENASQGFRQANRNFSQSSRAIDAIDDGRTAALRGRSEDTIPRFQGLTPEGQTGFRAGYSDPLIEQAQTSAFGVNKARPLINDAFQAEGAAMAPGNSLMQRRIGREDTMFQTRNAATGNSKTAENLNDDAAMGVDPTMIWQALSGNIGGALRSAVSAVSNGWNGNTAGVREAAARLLMQRGQNVNPATIQRLLDEAVGRIELVSNVARQLGRGASSGVAVAPSANGR